MLKFVVGLTDVEDYDGFIYDSTNLSDSHVSYNIRKPTTEIEKASIEWKINTNLDAVKHVIPLWEKIIRAPHLCMVDIDTQPYKFHPDFSEYYLSLSYVNLLPVSKELINCFTDNDYENCMGDADFGDLCINMYENIDINEPHNCNILSAFYKNDITILSDASVRGSVLPKFFAQFPLRGNQQLYSWRKNEDFVKFINDNKNEIIAKGYDVNSNRITDYGSITIGKLFTDSNDTYEALTKYPRICRTSFVQTEE